MLQSPTRGILIEKSFEFSIWHHPANLLQFALVRTFFTNIPKWGMPEMSYKNVAQI